jgi:hypothetical protein
MLTGLAANDRNTSSDLNLTERFIVEG